MCGIGAISTREPCDSLEAVALAIAEQQRHRGPDRQAAYVSPDRRMALSHDRLSIVDLSACGNQPMSSEDGTLWLVCNGEIYNHVELRERLEAQGHRFHSRSDSETILHLYEEYGTDLLEHLHGMFAFALCDLTKSLLFCARDRLGKKPLVYAQTPEGVVLASEIPALLRFPGVDTTVDPVALGLYLLRNVRHIPDPWTYYKGVRRLMPGHAMVVADGCVQKTWRYWHPDFTPLSVGPEQVREVFDRAVALRRVADVEVGALLSGGVDSSAIVQAMIAQGSEGVRTYALGLNRDDEDLVRARRMAELLRTNHKEFYFDPARQHEQLEVLLKIHGEPIMLLPLTYTLEICQHIRDDGLRVVMCGHGADEIFYGYDGNNGLALVSTFLPFVPSPLRRWLGGFARRFGPGSRLRETLLVASSPEGERKAALYKDEARRLWANLLNIPDVDRRIEESISRWFSTWFEESKPAAYIDEANILGLMHENTHSVTIAGDLPVMAASVEARCPFLDQDLVQLAWHTSYRQKVRRGGGENHNKWILKKALEGRVPRDLLYASKRGFGFQNPEADVLRGPWKARVDRAFATMSDLGGILKADAVRALKADFDRNGGVPAMLIAKLYAMQLSAQVSET